MEWRSIRWTRAARLGGIAVGGLAAIALASAVVGSPEAPRLDRDIGLRVAAPAPLPTTASEDPRLATSPVPQTVKPDALDRRPKPQAERPRPTRPPRPQPARQPSSDRGTPSPAPAVVAPAPTPAPAPPVATPPGISTPPPVAAPAAPPTGGGVEQEFGFEN